MAGFTLEGFSDRDGNADQLTIQTEPGDEAVRITAYHLGLETSLAFTRSHLYSLIEEIESLLDKTRDEHVRISNAAHA